MCGIVERLSNDLPALPTKLQVAAKYAVDNPDRIAFGSMRAAAAECGVSSPTMLRLARHFGYNSYDTFRALFQSEVSANNFGSRAERLFKDHGNVDYPLLGRMREAAHHNIDALFDTNAESTLEAMAEIVRTAKTLHIVATGSMAWVAGHIENTGGIAFPGLRATRLGFASAVETLSCIGPEDAVLGIGIAPYAKSGVEAVQYARELGVRTLSITDRRSSPLASLSDHCLIVQNDSPHYYASVVPVCAAIETILAVAVANSRGGAVQRIEKVVELRQRSGAYID